MTEKTRLSCLFLGTNLNYHVVIPKDQIPAGGTCVNIKSAPFIKDGEYKILSVGEVEYLNKKYPTIFVNRIGDFKTYLFTLDFSKTLVPGY